MIDGEEEWSVGNARERERSSAQIYRGGGAAAGTAKTLLLSTSASIDPPLVLVAVAIAMAVVATTMEPPPPWKPSCSSTSMGYELLMPTKLVGTWVQSNLDNSNLLSVRLVKDKIRKFPLQATWLDKWNNCMIKFSYKII